MRARDLAGFDDEPGAAAEEPGAAVAGPGADDEEPGAAEGDATETGLAACICFGLWRRYAIVNTSPGPQNLARFPPDRDNVVGSLAERPPHGIQKACRLSGETQR